LTAAKNNSTHAHAADPPQEDGTDTEPKTAAFSFGETATPHAKRIELFQKNPASARKRFRPRSFR
jgi:hypothetical protein